MNVQLVDSQAQWLRVTTKATEVSLRQILIPTQSALHPNYPNPFNPETWLPYQLSDDSHVISWIYDPMGRVIRHLDLGEKPSGYYLSKGRAAYWDGKNRLGEQVASGIYFYQLQADNFTATRKMLVKN